MQKCIYCIPKIWMCSRCERIFVHTNYVLIWSFFNFIFVYHSVLYCVKIDFFQHACFIPKFLFHLSLQPDVIDNGISKWWLLQDQDLNIKGLRHQVEKDLKFKVWDLVISFFIFFKEMFCPRDMIGLLRSNLGIFLLRKFGVVGVFVLIYQECNLAAHSFAHASFIMRRGLTRFQLPKGFIGLRIAECRNSSDILEWGPGALQEGNITIIALNHL